MLGKFQSVNKHSSEDSEPDWETPGMCSNLQQESTVEGESEMYEEDHPQEDDDSTKEAVESKDDDSCDERMCDVVEDTIGQENEK